MDKKSLRKMMGEKLQTLDRFRYEQMSYEIGKSLVDTEEWKEAKTVALTVSRFPEVDTWQLIRKGWDQSKRVVVPKCHAETKQMTFRQIHSFTNLEHSFFGLFEPKEHETDAVSKEEIDLVIVPGLLYNRAGYRVGFGGGYYDRFLKDYRGYTISLAFSFQLIDHLPHEEYDIPIGKMITEKEIIRT
ncbi:5-formyltetrahydrofolate cyclo-ligase [Siminovitchia sp. FSL H7-0308]|uniref:5-formyltetrahydrofolate cyclo-ligase n=1 Tax=Siminovitchia thermophila TaxID=1245522 RepID=A0ABS2R333_9BACI|nr:5-formyltetrahydrofolate cyclo-ligase [Siminovitchia thermophila]MBM7713810.1 5-formyltetrahydrofolate cyclo-ligase [Siminovitchia thermophila]ONK24692.1 5-formyltetrahydrofolate cyclo-ligase [Bacillus sp. VT-16-64]